MFGISDLISLSWTEIDKEKQENLVSKEQEGLVDRNKRLEGAIYQVWAVKTSMIL